MLKAKDEYNIIYVMLCIYMCVQKYILHKSYDIIYAYIYIHIWELNISYK